MNISRISPLKWVLDFLIRTNLFISLAAVCLTLETLLLWEQRVAFHPYLMLVFCATLCTYNFHRFLTIWYHQDALKGGKHAWVLQHKQWFYLLVFVSVAGFCTAAFLAVAEVRQVLVPFALITLFYIIPMGKFQGRWVRLRDIPYVKIFLIALVWAGVTVLLPLVKAGIPVSSPKVLLHFFARCCFIFSITLPFDIRDQKEDKAAGLNTLANHLGEIQIYRLAYGSILNSILLSFWTFAHRPETSLALACSGLITLFFLAWPKARKHPYYHYGILDGMLCLQPFLVWICGKI